MGFSSARGPVRIEVRPGDEPALFPAVLRGRLPAALDRFIEFRGTGQGVATPGQEDLDDCTGTSFIGHLGECRGDREKPVCKFILGAILE